MPLSLRSLFQLLAGALQKPRKALWRITGRPAGVHALPITESGRIVLVRLTYAPGWRLPGGGLKRREAPADGILRELREEIGLIGHQSLQAATENGADPALGTLFLVKGVHYRPRRSIEIEAVQEFDRNCLPQDLTARSRRWVDRLLPLNNETSPSA